MKKLANLKGVKLLSKQEQKMINGGGGRCLPGFYPPAECEFDSDCTNGKHCDRCTGQCVY